MCGPLLRILLYIACLVPGLSVAADVNASKTGPPLRVLTEHLPPYQVAEGGKLVGGSNYDLVVSILRRAGLETDIEVMPWARAYKTALGRANTLIFSMMRSPEREALFHWLAPLNTMDYAIYVSANLQDDKARSRITDYNAVAVRDTYEVTLLEQMGFENGVNLQLTASHPQVWRMIDLGRAELTVSTPSIFQSKMAQLKLQAQRFREIPTARMAVPMYLAANLNSDSDLLARIQGVVAVTAVNSQ